MALTKEYRFRIDASLHAKVKSHALQHGFVDLGHFLRCVLRAELERPDPVVPLVPSTSLRKHLASRRD
jgi:hypothetical protein